MVHCNQGGLLKLQHEQSPPSHVGSVEVPLSQKYSLLMNGGTTPENVIPVLEHIGTSRDQLCLHGVWYQMSRCAV